MTCYSEFKLLPTQYKFLFGYDHSAVDDNSADVLLDVSLYQGGMGSGKTYSGALRGLLYALSWPGCKGLVGAYAQDMLDDTTKAKYIEHLQTIGMQEDVHYWFINKGNTLVLKNGSTITFKTMSDWRQFRSREYTWIEIEEASLVTEKDFKELMARLREPRRPGWRGYFRSIFLHTNPSGARGWIYKLFINKKTRKKNYRCVIAPSSENVFLSKGYIENLLDLFSAEEAQELIYGRDCESVLSAFPSFNEANVLDSIPYNKDLPLILTCDFNFNPMCWYIVQYDDKTNTWYVLKELIHNNVTTQKMCELILPELERYGTMNLTIAGDAHGRDKKTNGSDYGTMLSFFSSKGYDLTLRVQSYNPKISERLAVFRRAICTASGTRSFFVDRSCTKLLYNFEMLQSNLSTGGLQVPTETQMKENPDLVYLIHPVDAVSYPIYFEQTMRDVETNSK